MRATTLTDRGNLADRVARVPPLVLDVLLSLLFSAAGLYETAHLVHFPAGASLGDWVVSVAPAGLLLIATLSLSLRRNFPLSVMVVTTITLALNEEIENFATGWVTFMIASFSAGLHGSRRRDLLAAFATLAVGVTIAWFAASTRANSDPSFLALWALALAIWWVGDVMRTRTRQAADLRAHAIRLELEREHEAAQAATAERARIARELHDVIAHSLSVMVIKAAAARRVLHRDPAKAMESLDAVEQTGRAAMVEMRRLLGVVRRDELPGAPRTPQPSIASLEALVRETEEAGLTVKLRVDGQPRALPSGVDVSAFRIVQEALTNALRHAHASGAEVSVRYLPDAVELEVLDDGQGARQKADPDAPVGHGLVGMRERVALLRGELEVGPNDGGGYRVRARLPIGPNAV